MHAPVSLLPNLWHRRMATEVGSLDMDIVCPFTVAVCCCACRLLGLLQVLHLLVVHLLGAGVLSPALAFWIAAVALRSDQAAWATQT